jgi:hypothetical protein
MDFEIETNIHSKWQALAVLPKAQSIIIKFINKLLDLDTQYFYKRKVIKKTLSNWVIPRQLDQAMTRL